MQLASVFSLGRIVDAIARAIGWSPAGRELELHGAEGPDASLFEGTTGRVLSVDSAGITLACDRNVAVSADGSQSIHLAPRHVGWTGLSLMLCDVAVVATARAPDGRDVQSIAIATLLRRTRGRSPVR